MKRRLPPPRPLDAERNGSPANARAISCGNSPLSEPFLTRGIAQQGDRYLRLLLVVGALAVSRSAKRHGSMRRWLVQLIARRTTRVAAVALAD